MKKVTVRFTNNSKKRFYQIFIDSGLIKKITSIINVNSYSKIFVITDHNVKKLYHDKILSSLPNKVITIVLPSGEKEKNIVNIQKIWAAMHAAQCDRKSLIINLGGGVISDMGGFAASTFMRGVNFINIPTTLLSQVDASVGGKTGIDFDGIKNLIGTFNQPQAVIADIQTLTTLPKREFLSGFAEIIKHGLIRDKKYFEKITSKSPFEFTQDEIKDIILKSCHIKADIIKNDETENNSRRILNFGHTIGHAIESHCLETSLPLLHGEAISIGMLAEAEISHYMNLLTVSDLKLIRKVLINAELPVFASGLQTEKIIKTINSDKKTEKGIVNFTLLSGIGNALFNQHVPIDLISKVIESITKKSL
ncbi:3-dehydroquinate synthase [Candidatus Roizmanbacteria bacterium RIFCSPHIGHO2_02_FULL_37_13b]|uniref:3-dehydroquinate synthase n=1 Tax=Candidatus Roizmanbacteria bacterium RIFCSPLOWO2_02_FULL_36_11 TaxID=1802071 RepID=A0A1F7JGM0_9BACT|nr:MAG: 3-dehydroquinate synthase [Candidatus Roizmanbacteria bacterium RIFCSPHIGHO2_02_FULL_37_13b]OGK54742.1 MAG: 3-dehydroquinate synthase [Candidatus Roizmanbacteria bacterium RIFCSPLOWO2_02_FULL_36_11]